MRRRKLLVARTWLTWLSLLLSLCAGFVRSDGASAAPKGGEAKRHKVASDLRNQIQRASQTDAKVILQLNDRMRGPLNALLKSNGVRVKK
jgi:hypothetical protein